MANEPDETPHRTVLRVARAIHEHLFATATHRDLPRLPTDCWNDLVQADRRLELAMERNWQAAARETRMDIERITSALVRRLEELQRTAGGDDYRPPPIATLHELYDDIQALSEEFDSVRFDIKGRIVSVTTERIVLEDIDLGPFEIVLAWERSEGLGPREVRALDPNPAASSPDTTHPHVRDASLCEGEGRTAIRRALRQGRVLDFFVLTRQILRTYRSDSAFVALADWGGLRCSDCECVIAADDSTFCECCESDLCYECSRCCEQCGRTCCAQCVGRCAACDTDNCQSCLAPCVECKRPVCHACFQDLRCPRCEAMRKETSKNETTNAKTAKTKNRAASGNGGRRSRPALHSVGVGQTSVPA
jgi:hypothetical protein